MICYQIVDLGRPVIKVFFIFEARFFLKKLLLIYRAMYILLNDLANALVKFLNHKNPKGGFMLNFVKKAVRNLFGPLLWIVLILFTVGGAIGGGVGGGTFLGLVLGLIVGLLYIIFMGGFFALFIELESNTSKMTSLVEDLNVSCARMTTLLEKIANEKSGESN